MAYLSRGELNDEVNKTADDHLLVCQARQKARRLLRLRIVFLESVVAHVNTKPSRDRQNVSPRTEHDGSESF